LLPSGKFFWLAIGVPCLLTALLALVVAGVSVPATSFTLSNLLQTAIVLWSVFCAYHVARRSSGRLRQLWMLLASALFLAAAAQGLETYYENVVHAPTLAPRPSDILFILWVTPALMMLLPRVTEEPTAVDWQQVLDFAQIGVVALTAYLYFFYVPSRWEAEGRQMVLKMFRLQLLRDMALAAGFMIRAATNSLRSRRALFGGVGGLFLLSGATDLIFLLAPIPSPDRATWMDVIWCAPFVFAAGFAATWKHEEEPFEREVRSPFRGIIVSQVLPVLIPLLVLFMGHRIAAEQLTIAWVAVTASFVLSAGRLVLTNEQQKRIAEDLLQTKQDLLRSEQMFSRAFRSTPDAVGITALPEGQFLEVNDSFTRFTGYSHEETLGKTPLQLNLWKDPFHRARVMAKLEKDWEVREEEFECLTKWGETRVGQFSGTLIELNGRPCVLAMIKDVTARRKAEEALRASEERFRNLVQDLHIGVVLLGPGAETLFANRAALESFGMSKDQAVGKKSSHFGMTAIHEDGTEIPFSMRPGPVAIATRQPIRNQVVGWRRPNSNEVLWTMVDAVPHLTSDGEVANVILSITNITERKQAEEALRASEERFRTLVRDFDVGVVLLGPGLVIQFANQAAEKMFRVPIERVVGKTSTELGWTAIREDGSEIPISMRPGSLALKTGQAVKNQVIGWRRPDSSEVLWTLGNAVPQFAQDGSVSVVINSYTNITERRQAEEALRQLSARLLQLQDEERRRLGRELHDSLAQSVLAVNLNLAQAAGAMASLDQKSRHALEEARRVLQEMSREIRTLSYLLHPPLLDELGLVSAVKEYAEGFSERSGIHLDVDLQAGFQRLPQEAETALFRILQESLSNIQRHSESQTANIHLRGDSNGVSLEIADQGRGMGNAGVEHGNGGGTRLGVGILGMRERMIQLGGKLDIESSSSGTTVRATIPLKTEVSNAPAHPRRR
jgi:PAS domain S-box-containing protein